VADRHLAPDFKTIADFRRNNGAAIRKVCREFVLLCRRLGLFAQPLVAIDGSKFKAVNTRDKNYTRAKVQRRIEQIEESVARYELDSADRRGDAEVNEAHTRHLRTKSPRCIRRCNACRPWPRRLKPRPTTRSR